MDEGEWKRCSDLTVLLQALLGSGKGTDRKFRLFACAYWRQSLPLLALKEAKVRQIEGAIGVAERFADGLAAAEELKPLRPLRLGIASGTGRTAVERALPGVAERMCRTSVWYWPQAERLIISTVEADRQQGLRWAHCSLLDDIFGPVLFRPLPTLAHEVLSWNDGIVPRLAQSAYEDRTLPGGTLHPDRLSILADALEEGGYSDVEILGHLRSPGPHVRGCFALDAILGKK